MSGYVKLHDVAHNSAETGFFEAFLLRVPRIHVFFGVRSHFKRFLVGLFFGKSVGVVVACELADYSVAFGADFSRVRSGFKLFV